jgi:citrate lyase beta subunit
MRSKLFVPGSRPELFAKAIASAADAISFDVEDSVPDEGKARARAAIVDFLASGAARESARMVIVRTNAPDSPHFEEDLRAFARPEVALLNLPKIGDTDDVCHAAAALEKAERDAKITAPLRLLINIETPRALRLAADIARSHERVAGLQLGLTDLCEQLGFDRGDERTVHACMLAMRLGAAEAGRFACDSAYPDVADEAGYRREAVQARALGYIGKSCVHPRQVALANEIFGRDDDLAHARRVIEAARDAAARGRGAFLLDGRMIDGPAIRRAEALLAAASRTP